MIACDAQFTKGEEMGWFQHGSTILVFAPAGYTLCDNARPGSIIRAGQPLLRMPWGTRKRLCVAFRILRHDHSRSYPPRREARGKAAALAGLAFDFERGLVPVQYMFDDRQTKSSAAGCA